MDWPPKFEPTLVLKTKGAIIDIISQVKALEGGTDDVREARQAVYAAVQIPGGHKDPKWDEGNRSDCPAPQVANCMWTSFT